MHAMKGDKTIYGVTTVGEKGQVVIPSEAREALQMRKGQKLLVFGMGHEMVAFAKLSDMEALASHLSKHLTAIRTIIKKNKKERTR